MHQPSWFYISNKLIFKIITLWHNQLVLQELLKLLQVLWPEFFSLLLSAACRLLLKRAMAEYFSNCLVVGWILKKPMAKVFIWSHPGTRCIFMRPCPGGQGTGTSREDSVVSFDPDNSWWWIKEFCWPVPTRDFHGQLLCDDCYMDALSPARTCDPWAEIGRASCRERV